MTYAEVISYLYGQLPMFQRLGASAYKADLSNTLALDKILNHPHKAFKTIHVAGTNGKGSTSHFLASIFQEAGYKVGLYTSPHLVDFRERIKINGSEIPESEVIRFVEQYKGQFEAISLSFFEWTVGLAFHYFKEQSVDIAIIETGMGGRLDSTNIVQPELSIITNISFDHQQFLGDTLPKIAAEKAGIIKFKTPVLIGRFQAEIDAVYRQKANEMQSELFYSKDFIQKILVESPLLGAYQKENLQTVIAAHQLLSEKFSLTNVHLMNGVKHVVENTKLMGRWMNLGDHPKIIADVGHNEDGIQQVVAQIKQHKFSKLIVVWGTVNDKDFGKILSLLPKDAYYIFCKPDIPRGLDANLLALKAKEIGLNGLVKEQPSEALEYAKSLANTDDFVFVGGSTFVVADILKNILG